MQYSINDALKTHFFVFLKMKIFNRAERYTLFALYGSVRIYFYIHIHVYKKYMYIYIYIDIKVGGKIMQ